MHITTPDLKPKQDYYLTYDFWPHGGLAQKLGILRTDGTTERALFLVDKKGVIRFIDVHDINSRPDLGPLVKAMEQVHSGQ